MLLHQMAPMNPQLTLSLGLAGRLDSASASVVSAGSHGSDLPDAAASPPKSSIPISPEETTQGFSQLPPVRRPDSPHPLTSLSVMLNDLPQRGDVFLRSGGGGAFGVNARRPSYLELHGAVNSRRIVDDDARSMAPRTLPPPVRLTSNIKARTPGKTRLGLPITLHKEGVMATVLSCADTGADVNIMSDELAKTLGYTTYDTLSDKKQFALANGKLVEAVGQIESTCSFGVETESSETLTCMFYILLKAATPIIMGLDFLEQTKTMTEHRERLVRVPRPAFQALSVCAIDRPRNLLACELDRRETMATPDSGSDIDMMSPYFASERGLKVHLEEDAIELADGSIATTTGFVRAEVSIDGSKAFNPYTHLKSIATVDFFVLDSLAHDLIVGEDSLEELRVFTEHQHALVPAPHNSAPLGLNRIRYLGAVDRIVSWIKKKIKGGNSDQGEQGTYIHDDL
jgi:hypothetical protein